MEKECGYIHITSEQTNSIISCGSKSFKGFMKNKDVEFEYINGDFVITDTRTKKSILKIKCPVAIVKEMSLDRKWLTIQYS
jgi:hypothetical protein